MSMKNSTDTIGNRTRDLPFGSTVPQPTAPPCMYVCAYMCVYYNVKVIVYHQLRTSAVYLDAVLIVVAYELQKRFSGIMK